jgi:hypothetical protein
VPAHRMASTRLYGSLQRLAAEPAEPPAPVGVRRIASIWPERAESSEARRLEALMTVLSQGQTLASDAGAEATSSPFAGFIAGPSPEGTPQEVPAWSERALESPFGPGVAQRPGQDEAEELAEAVTEFLAELEDEDFADAVEALVDEAASRHLTDLGSWSAPPSAAEAYAHLESWIEPLAAEAETALDRFAASMSGTDLVAMSGHELSQLLDSSGEVPALGVEGFDQFLGGLLDKAKKAVSGAVNLAKRGIAFAGQFLPVGILLGRLKGLVRPLLRRVLQAAINRLPTSVRPIARILATRLGLSESEETSEGEETEDGKLRLAEDFDLEVATLLMAPDAMGPAQAEATVDGTSERPDPVGELDAARERLAQRLTDLPAGTNPASEIEQFIPAVLAVRPLIRIGISLIGRDRVVRFIADRIAGLIKGLVGADAARQLSGPIVDVGLRLLGFEAANSSRDTLVGEALASTVEGTVLRLLELPAETFADELQLDSAVQQAFAEAAAAYIPDRFLRADLPERETAGEGGIWILLPRTARPQYRQRQYTYQYRIPIGRQLARAVPWSDGGTLETYLLDHGAQSWPVHAEVDLHEAVPGTHLGHLGLDEREGQEEQGVPEDFQPLTPEVAGLLLGEPGLGRGSMTGWQSRHVHSAIGRPTGRRLAGVVPRGRLRWAPGRPRPMPLDRYFRVRPVDIAVGAPARPRRRVVVSFALSGPTPAVRIALRLTERQAQQTLARLEPSTPGGQRDLPGALRDIRNHYHATLPAAVVSRLLRTALAANAASAGAIADRISAGVSTALSTFLAERATALAAAVRDPANGITITVTFPGVTRQSLTRRLPPGHVTVTPGWAHRG